MPFLTSTLEIGEDSADALLEAAAQLLESEESTSLAEVTAPDVLFDLCAQYVVKTMRQFEQWDEDTLVAEYLRQMRGEQWSTIRRVAERSRRGSRRAQRMFLCLADVALRRRDAPPMGQARAFLTTVMAYARGGMGIGSAAVYPLTLVLGHHDLKRIEFDNESSAHRRLEREWLRDHIRSERLRAGPNLQAAWRTAIIGLAIARRGAVALTRARGEDQVSVTSHEQALSEVGGQLMRGGILGNALARTSLIRDITERFLSRPSALPTLLG